MTPAEHENYARDLLLALAAAPASTAGLDFTPRATQTRNAARAMTAILCHRLRENSPYRARQRKGSNFEWNGGTFNCRNIADRDYLWTNIRRDVAAAMHDLALANPAAYLLSFSSPSNAMLSVWALPEFLIYDSLPSLPQKADGQSYSVEIHVDKQRIEHSAISPDLAPYFQRLNLSQNEVNILQEAREIDASVKGGRKISDIEDEMNEAGQFDPHNLVDGRERVLSSIVRRRGQPAFRKRLLAAYECACAISGCGVEDVLEAAHIVPYRGPETNRPANGLLLRADLHTLFDLRLIAIDTATMSVLLAPMLAATPYSEFAGRVIRLPSDRKSRPSRKALDKHRRESGL